METLNLALSCAQYITTMDTEECTLSTNDRSDPPSSDEAELERFRDQHFKRRRARILLVLFATILLGVALKFVDP